MAPINWLSLFIFFISIFYLFNVKMYFLTSYSSPLKKFSINSVPMTWKW
uniref:ATP synthase F0 subunit 8 n=1 Tax=Apoderinae sp. 2 AV-2018 TaxID=2480750 RepID=A0A3G2JZA1_9CUCU|nr:ATP synthase F0 subunit 8 [Apoderinae sp. 2 AV-2018]